MQSVGVRPGWGLLAWPTRLARHRWGVPNVLFVVLMVLLGGLVVVPFYFVIRSSFRVDTGPDIGSTTVANYTDILTNGDLPRLIGNSLTYAVGSGAVGLVIGTLLAWIVERTNTPFRSLAYLSAYAGLAVPGVLTVIGWILLLGPQAGLINVALERIFNLDSAPFDMYGMWGMILVHGMHMVPVVFLLMVGPFRSTDVSLQEAAAMSGARPISVFFRISSRLAKPTVLSVLILTVVTSLESFETPALVGIPGGVKVLTTQVYLSVHASLRPRYGLSAAYGAILIVFVVIGLWYYARTTRQADRYVTISGRGMRLRRTDLGRWRWLTALAVLFLPLTLLLPLLVMLWASFLPTYTAPSMDAVRSMTLANYSNLLGNKDIYTAFLNSLKVSVATATAAVLLSAVAAWLITRSNIRARGLLDYAVTLPLVIPGIVLGVALLQAYLTLPIPIYGTVWLLILAFVTKYMPYGMRFASPGLLQVGRELEEAAHSSGAGWFRTFRRIVLPLMAGSLAGAWIYIFLLSMKELSVALLLYTPGTQLMAVQIFNMWTHGEIVALSAFGITVTVALLVVALVFRRFTARYSLRQL